MRKVASLLVLGQLIDLIAAYALPQSVSAPNVNQTQSLADFIDALIGTNIAVGGTNTQSNWHSNEVINAAWFRGYTVDLDNYSSSSGPIQEPAGSRRSIDSAHSKRAEPSILQTSFTNTSYGAGYLLRLDPSICTNIQLGTWNDPQTSSGNPGDLSAFFEAYLSTQKTNQQWIDWTRQNILVTFNRFLQIVDSTQCPAQPLDGGLPQLTLGRSFWESNFVNTVNGLSASFGPAAGNVLSIGSTNPTTTPPYNLAVGYIIATCNDILFRLSSSTALGQFERILLNLFAQYAANLAGSWNFCTSGINIATDLSAYVRSFDSNKQALQQIAAPNEKGGSPISTTPLVCTAPRKVRV